MPSGQSRDALGPWAGSLTKLRTVLPARYAPLVKRLCPVCIQYAGLGKFRSVINMVTYSTMHSLQGYKAHF